MFPCCEWPISSPPSNMGTPCDSSTRRQKGTLLLGAERQHGQIVGGAFDAAVPTDVVVGAVAIVFAVGFVVFVVVADQVGQREAVVAGDEIDAGVRPPAAPFVQIARAAEARGEFRRHAAVPFPEMADAIAILAVPLRPQRRKVAHLVAPFAQIPGLGDQLYLRDDRVLVDDVEEGPQLVDFVQFAGERAGQIEAKAVDVHFQHPVAQDCP